MYYFDFHTHAFVDAIAERAVASLQKTSGIQPATNGTASGLSKLCRDCGIKKHLILPVATKPSQQTNINNWAAEIQGEDTYCCGSVHPDAEDVLDEIERIKSLGLCGVKLHPEYQLFYPDEEKMLPIYRKAAELGLFVVFHGGWDPLSPDFVRAEPERLAKAAEAVPEMTMIAAHLGGFKLWDDAEKYLAGKYENVYLDVSVTADDVSDEQALRIIKAQGADKVLFGSDAPWDNPMDEINMINRLPLSDEERELICYKNAEKLIGVQ